MGAEPAAAAAMDRHAAVKRMFDLAIAGPALLLLAPLLLLIALAIKLEGPGPVWFRQPRVGQHGREFLIHKFRSMRHGAEGPALTIGDDARITPLGRWLRRHRLDELPQLIDVLAGSMSMVGPRPELPRYAATVPEPLRSRWLAHKPGITDPASLAHADEAARLALAADPQAEYVQRILPAKLRASLDYAERATPLSDLGVLARSLRVLVMGHVPGPDTGQGKP